VAEYHSQMQIYKHVHSAHPVHGNVCRPND